MGSQLFSILMFFYTSSCIYDHRLNMDHTNNISYLWNEHRQLISTIQNYQIQGSIVYTTDSHQKTYIKFLWIKHNDKYHHIKLFNILGFTIISICVKNGIIHIDSNIIYQNNDLIHQIQKWFIQTHFFEKQLTNWIVGLPGDNTKYYLNNSGCLSNVNYCVHNDTISILYQRYCTNNNLILPEVIEVFYDKYIIKLNINFWNL